MTRDKPEIVMDTNVAVVANYQHEQAGLLCIEACTNWLIEIKKNFRILIDDQNYILREYGNRLSLAGQPGIGDAFYKWLYDNQGYPENCRRVNITSHPDRVFKEFPDDEDLRSFDLEDRKFVAVALNSGTGPSILNASDRDWSDHREALERHSLNIVFLCPKLMKPRQ